MRGILVAALDSPLRAQADYVCDGIDDQVELNAAIAEAEGKRLRLDADGTFHCRGWLEGRCYQIHLRGQINVARAEGVEDLFISGMKPEAAPLARFDKPSCR